MWLLSDAWCSACHRPQVKLLEQPGQQAISIAQFLGKAVEPPLQQSVTSAIQVGRCWQARGVSVAKRGLAGGAGQEGMVWHSPAQHCPSF